MIDNERFKLHIEALESMLEEKKGISDDIKDRYALLKGEGYDVKATQAVIRRRAIERADVEEHDALVAVYEENLS